MLRTGKLTLAALTVTLLLGIAVSNASANNLSTNEGGFRIAWSHLEFIEPTFEVGVRCPVTIEGSFHSTTIRKVVGALIGQVTRVDLTSSTCTGGHATALTETLPWAVSYQGFGGTLPDITSIKVLLLRPAFRLEINSLFSINCLSQPTRINGILAGTYEAVRNAFRPERLSPENEGVPCGSVTGQFRSEGEVTRRNSTERILIRLI